MIDYNDFKLWDDFLATWPMDKIANMTLQQYTNVEDKTTFTYWLEHILRPYGSIRGGSAEKFAIFKKKNRDATPKSHLMSNDEYTWNPKYGSTPEQAFEKIHSLIIQVIEYIKSDNLLAIEAIDLPFTLKWKVAFHYQNRDKPRLVAIFNEKALSIYFNQSISIVEAAKRLEDQLSADTLMPLSVKIWTQSDNSKTAAHDYNEEDMTSDKQIPLNQILYGPPGTGKTYHTIIKALEIIGEETEGKDRADLKQIFDEKVQSGQIVFTTFHQSMCYEDFIEGIKPVLVENETSAIGYQVEVGIFKALADKARVGTIDRISSIDHAIEQFKQLCSEQKIELKTSTNKSFYVEYHGNTTFKIYPENSIHEDLGNGYPASIASVIEYIKTEDLKNSYNSSYVRAIGNYLKSKYRLNLISKTDTNKQNFVLIIDEINRGNVAQIFGELITLIEEDKRLGNQEALTVTLPYSKESFGVPNNLYIIGTMNTADRSVEALDSALRRRFSFREMLSEPVYLVNQQGERLTIDGIVLADLLYTINQRLELLLDRDHQIGHSYLLNVTNTEQLYQVFANKIIPLLQEYFFNDYAKIGLVLGNGFVKKIEVNIAFAHNDYPDQEKSRYQLITINKDNIISALETMNIQPIQTINQ